MIRIKFSRRFVGMAVLALVFMGVIFTSKTLSSPQYGSPAKITTLPKTKQLLDDPKPLPATTNDQQYFSLALPAGYSVQGVSPPAGSLLFSQTIIKPSSQGSTIITISIQRLPEGGLGEDSSYRLRQSNTARYSLNQQTINGEPVTLANDAEAASVVAFWPHGQYFATVSASQGISNPASDNNVAVQKVLTTLLDGWTWK